MEIFNEELYEKVKRGNKKIVSYFSYPIGTRENSYIATDDADTLNESMHDDPLHSDVVNMVDLLINTARRLIGRPGRDNKDAVKCEVEGIVDPIYFIGYDNRRIIATSIRNRDSTEHPINQL